MTTSTTTHPSVLRRLRALIPARNCTFVESLVIAERQATRLSELTAMTGTPLSGVKLSQIERLPRLRIVYADDLPVSGMSHWNGHEWILTISSSDSPARQRFTVLHELKHVIDHGASHRLYVGDRRHSAEEQAELAADYFAGCALVSKRDLKRAWGNGLQRPAALAAFFGVSEQAVRVRLAQTGLDLVADQRPTPRCARPVHTAATRPQRFRLTHPRWNRRSYA